MKLFSSIFFCGALALFGVASVGMAADLKAEIETLEEKLLNIESVQ